MGLERIGMANVWPAAAAAAAVEPPPPSATYAAMDYTPDQPLVALHEEVAAALQELTAGLIAGGQEAGTGGP